MSPEQFHFLQTLYNEDTVTITTVEFPSDINGGLKVCYRSQLETNENYFNKVIEMDSDGRISRAESLPKG